MTRGETRVARLEARIGADQCNGSLCVKCILAKLNAGHTGKPWGGCDGRPSGLSDLLRRLSDRELALLAGVADSATDEELATVVATGAGHWRDTSMQKPATTESRREKLTP